MRYEVFWDLRSVEWRFLTEVSGQTAGPETSVRNNHSTLRKISEDRKSVPPLLSLLKEVPAVTSFPLL
jgi:hypothetical protein